MNDDELLCWVTTNCSAWERRTVVVGDDEQLRWAMTNCDTDGRRTAALPADELLRSGTTNYCAARRRAAARRDDDLLRFRRRSAALEDVQLLWRMTNLLWPVFFSELLLILYSVFFFCAFGRCAADGELLRWKTMNCFAGRWETHFVFSCVFTRDTLHSNFCCAFAWSM